MQQSIEVVLCTKASWEKNAENLLIIMLQRFVISSNLKTSTGPSLIYFRVLSVEVPVLTLSVSKGFVMNYHIACRQSPVEVVRNVNWVPMKINN